VEKESANITTKTHRRLRKAYCRLMEKTDAEKINVSTLTEEADVSRATFYLYYQNIEKFKEDTENYIVELFIRQISLFISKSRSEVMDACKRKKLIFTEDDFKLFFSVFKNNRGFLFESDELMIAFKAMYGNVGKYFSPKFIRKNMARFNLFFIGYASVMRENFLDYHSDKAARDVLRSMDVWDFYFPEYKFKD
jgi:AcrR family transcriptional regulator